MAAGFPARRGLRDPGSFKIPMGPEWAPNREQALVMWCTASDSSGEYKMTHSAI